MFFEEYQKFASQYSSGIRSIKFRSYYPKTLANPTPDLNLKSAHGNYDLFFSKNGILTSSYHFDTPKPKIIYYAYNHNKRLVRLLSVFQKDIILDFITELTYNSSGKLIKEVVNELYYDEIKRIKNYQYEANNVIIEFFDEEDHDPCFIHQNYDSTKHMIEEKMLAIDDAIHYWERYEYNSAGLKVKIIPLDEHGNPESLYEYNFDDKGNEIGYKFTSVDLNYSKENIYQFDDKGNWTNKIILRDGEPQHIYEREIEYYSL